VASRGANKKKPRDPETEDTGQKSTGPLPQAVVDIGSTPTEMEGLHLQDREVNTPNPPDKISTSKDSELITTDIVHSPPQQEDSTDPPHQAGADMDRSPTGNEGLRPHERVGHKPDCPGKGPMSKDPERIMSKKS